MLVRKEDAPSADPDLTSSLRQIEGAFDIERFLAEEAPAGWVESYYRQSLLGYLLVHCRRGAMHFALEGGGFGAQVDIVRGVVEEIGAEEVLELASGTGFNAALLASSLPATAVCGVDLMPGHVRISRARARRLANLTFRQGDLHRLPLPSASFDAAYAIEGFCYAKDLDLALAELARVVRAGGRFVVIDGFVSTSRATLAAEQRTSAALYDKALALSRTWTIGGLVSVAEQHGFKLVSYDDLGPRVLLDAERIARHARRFLSHPVLARLSKRVLPPRLVANSIAGVLTPFMGEAGFSYGTVVLERCSGPGPS